ncbi:ThiF family adenylyltransferase [Streptomyces sp. MJP52]|uniref:ThiF family adenylyltransferase n=1 Tax=Streptomyces sp. MJP52 TaxID=2940555 RepID=UPI002476BBF9|nr:ThiF family adenylyltransferase [Streptomyces sp. MJP52]MDH6225090.1 bacteriocin biosynthesis cyclodehydratase domain-containing protein [Streptomyces sp. MJP52]
MHPRVKPALRRGWRDLNTVQFGMTPAHAMTLAPVDTATGTFLDLLNGTRGMELLREEAVRMGLPEDHADGLVERLAEAGLLDDATGGGPEGEALRERPHVLDRLRPDLASLSLTAPAPGDAVRRLTARRRLRVQVRGAGRVGAALAALLSAAGVGEVDVRDGGCVQPWDVAPGGLPPASVGERRSDAARRLVRDAAPERPPRRGSPCPFRDDAGFALVLLAPRDDLAVHSPDPQDAEPLLAAGIPHLYAGVVEGTGVVGPLVLPGETSCAGCLHRWRVERDPTWPRLLAQWRSRRTRAVAACDVALASAVAGTAAGHALAFLDGLSAAGSPHSAGVRWEAALPALRWRTRDIAPHPHCPCGAAERPEAELSGAPGQSQDTMAEHGPSAESCHRANAAPRPGTWRAHV